MVIGPDSFLVVFGTMERRDGSSLRVHLASVKFACASVLLLLLISFIVVLLKVKALLLNSIWPS